MDNLCLISLHSEVQQFIDLLYIYIYIKKMTIPRALLRSENNHGVHGILSFVSCIFSCLVKKKLVV